MAHQPTTAQTTADTPPALSRRWLLLPLVPAILALTAWVLRYVVKTEAQTLSESEAVAAALICVALLMTNRDPVADNTTPRHTPNTNRLWLWALVAAFAMSIVGDLCLHYHTTNIGYLFGIAFFLLAHIGYLVYALKRVAFRWPILAVIVVALFALYFVFYMPSPALRDSPAMGIAVLAYLLISCFSLAATVDLGSRSPARWVFTAAIACIILSDACLAFVDFAGFPQFEWPIMPLYYVAHTLIALSVTLEFSRR